MVTIEEIHAYVALLVVEKFVIDLLTGTARVDAHVEVISPKSRCSAETKETAGILEDLRNLTEINVAGTVTV